MTRLLTILLLVFVPLLGGATTIASRGPVRAAAAGGAAPTIGVSTIKGYDGAHSTTTSAITTQASGSTIVVAVVWQNGDGILDSISDSKSNTYTASGSVIHGTTSYAQWYTCANATGGSSHTITCAETGGYATVAVIEVIGAATSSVVDATGGNLDTSTPFTQAVTTTTTYDLVLSFCSRDADNTVDATATGWTEIVEGTTPSDLIPLTVSSITSPTATTVTASWTLASGTAAIVKTIALKSLTP